jgi:hypothetical protein
MAELFPEDLAAQQWANLTALLRTDPRVSAIKDVRQAEELWTEKGTPAAGVQLDDITYSPYSSTRKWMVCSFRILVACESIETTVGSNVVPPNLDDAMKQLQAIISDGVGNGISAVLRDPVNQRLSQTCNHMSLKSVKYVPSIEMGEPIRVWAYAYVSVQTHKPLTIV